MNFKINALSFQAKYTVYGKQSVLETDKVYGDEIKKLKANRSLATEAQGYMQTKDVQRKIAKLPKDSFVRLHTGILPEKKKDKILGFTPFLSFETRGINEQILLEKSLQNRGIGNLKLTHNEHNTLDKTVIDNWLDTLIDFYS